MLPSDVIYLVLTVQHAALLSVTKKHSLFQYSIEPGHSETYKKLSEDSH